MPQGEQNGHAPVSRRKLRRTLRKTFGFRSLREGQEEVIRSVMAGTDTLAIMPTGAGKSLCYQLPGAELPGTTVIVSPLISLMKDQADKLAERGIAAAAVNSTLGSEEERQMLAAIEEERREFVFVTPERVTRPEFIERLQRNTIDVFVIDEAHCMSQWGHDFRPAYLRLREVVEALGDPPVLALTATATERVIEDVRQRLGRPEMHVVATGIHRENLRAEVVRVADEEDKLRQLGRRLAGGAGAAGGTGIVYTSTIKDCEAVAEHLASLGHEVARYHGRLGARERHDNQDRFMAGELDAMVATNAFGMGIDKPDIRFVLHYNLPGSLEAYYQEAGRAGRDGEPADCILFYLPEDRNTQVYFGNGRYPKREHFRAVHRALTRLGEGASFDEMTEAAEEVARSKVQVALSAFEDFGIVEQPEPGRLRLLRPKLGKSELDELAALYEERAEGDRERLQAMVRYAQTALCRWRAIVEYFGGEAGFERCGHCDSCERPQPEPSPDRAVPSPNAEQPDQPLPLPPLPAGRLPASLAVGEDVNLPGFGAGVVQEAAQGRLVVAFGDGEVREFRG